KTDSFTDHFHSSISFDQRLYKQDINGSIAHVKMLAKQNIIPKEDCKLIEATLLGILDDIENNRLQFDESAEDIHMNIESILISRIGGVGKKLHTGRSRNDQVALDTRLYTIEAVDSVNNLIKQLISTLLDISENNVTAIMPGFTHLQKAQPITLAHHMLAYVEMLKRDYGRLLDTKKRASDCPLGSGALATTTYPLDRLYTAELLNFGSAAQNSMDAVSDRDFCIEAISALSILMMHLSRFCEEIIMWSSDEYRFIELDDAYSTGSSIMPQKKNPDMAELIRGKTGRVYGSLITLLTVMKALPLAYNKDMQEDKEPLFDAFDTVCMCLPIFTNMLSTMSINKAAMYKSAAGGFTNATDAADYLVRKGLPFRDAHEAIGKLVLYCIQKNKNLEALTIDEFKSVSENFDSDIYDSISLEACVKARGVLGGPSESATRAAISMNRKYLESI
ncbi:MAG: argininosuccinate lyase, partial [Clostridiales bacterium]|nr:argininosuccinate lyase [Clostridiales bacterium]